MIDSHGEQRGTYNLLRDPRDSDPILIFSWDCGTLWFISSALVISLPTHFGIHI